PHSADPAYDFLIHEALRARHDCLRLISLETRIMNEEIARQRLIHPDAAAPVLHALAFRRLADETRTMAALYRLEGAAIRRRDRALDRLRAYPVPPPAPLENEFCETN